MSGMPSPAASALALAGHQIRLLPPVTPASTLPLVQTIELTDEAGHVVASAMWFTQGTDGYVQLLDIRVDERLRRRRVGSRLFELLRKETSIFFKSRGGKLRRITADVEQKSQVVARAFLTEMGFHHVGTITNALKKQDVVIYLLALE